MPVMQRNGFSDAAQEARGIAHEMLSWLGEIAELIKRQWTESNTLYVTRVMNTLADTAAQDEIAPPPGVIWDMRRLSFTSATNGGFAIYRNDVQPQNLIDGEFSNAAIGARAISEGIVVKDGEKLILRFFNQPVNTVCTVNLQINETVVGE